MGAFSLPHDERKITHGTEAKSSTTKCGMISLSTKMLCNVMLPPTSCNFLEIKSRILVSQDPDNSVLVVVKVGFSFFLASWTMVHVLVSTKLPTCKHGQWESLDEYGDAMTSQSQAGDSQNGNPTRRNWSNKASFTHCFLPGFFFPKMRKNKGLRSFHRSAPVPKKSPVSFRFSVGIRNPGGRGT